VTISGRRADKIRAVADSIGCNAVAGDVTSAADRLRMIDEAVAFGGRLDALFNNAGNMLRGPIETIAEDQLLGLFRSNVAAPMLLTGLAVPHLAATKGAVVFVGSVHTRRAFPGASPYAASKGAIEILTKVLAAELGDRGIRVNCVVPGSILTELNVRAGFLTAEEAKARQEALLGAQALASIGTGEQIAEAVEYLIRAEWTTGAVIDVDGGMGLGVTRA
jgi:NAD(P)-dependent dehydrogenase (short-subunit alcohol dehydrogenase family)